MKPQLYLSLLAVSVLTACSDISMDGISLPIEQEPEAAPVAVNDNALAQNNVAVTIDVLANDTDENGDSLTVSAITTDSSELSGSVEISDNQIIYTPEHNFIGVETFKYTVSDGALESEAEVTVTVNHPLTVSGQVIDSPIANAAVTVSIGDEEYNTTADAEGFYDLAVTINDKNAQLLLNAVGSEANNQQNVELVSYLGQSISLLESIDDERILSSEESKAANVTHVSTATYLLAKERNGGEDFASQQAFSEKASEIHANELIETAGFIKLLVDNESFVIPEGKTSYSLFSEASSGDGALSTASAINAYLEEHNYVDENGVPTENYEQALAQAIEQTLSDPSVVDAFSSEMVSGKTMIALYGAREGWLELDGDGVIFAEDGTFNTYESQTTWFNTKDAKWIVNEGRIEVTELTPNISFDYIPYPFTSLVQNYGFSQDLADEMALAYESGTFSFPSQIEVERGYNKESYTLIAATDTAYQVNVKSEPYIQITLPEGWNWTNPKPKVDLQSETYTRTLVHNTDSLITDMTSESLTGKWVMFLQSEIKYALSNEPLSGIFANLVEINNGTATTELENLTLAVTLNDGVIELSSEELRYVFTPFKKENNEYLAKTELYVDEQLIYVTASKMAKFDDTAPQFIDELVTDLPKFQNAYINGWMADAWDGDLLIVDHIWGYQFKADGTLARGIQPYTDGEWNWDGIVEDHFYLGDDWTWDKTESQVNLYQITERKYRHRTWEVISVSEGGKALVRESSIYGTDDNYDGVVTEDEKGYLIMPRINIIKEDDLSDWEDLWKNTPQQNQTPQADTLPKQSHYSEKTGEFKTH